MINERDPYQVWDGEQFRFTINKVCKIIFDGKNYSLPSDIRKKADLPVTRVIPDNTKTTSDLRIVFDLSWHISLEESYKRILSFIKAGVIVVTNRKYTNDAGKELSVIHVDDVWEAWIKLGKYVKNLFPMPTIAITGSVGKTTSTMFAECVFSERYNTFVSGLDGRNFNTPLQIVNQWILRSGPQYNFHVQECGAMTPNLVDASAQILNVDGFGISNLQSLQHMDTYGSKEALIEDKTSFDRHRHDGTFGVINLDDEVLRDYTFQSPIITFAIEDQSADYIGRNIVQNGEMLEFDVVSKTETVHIRIRILGAHNAYNALMVFALAKKMGLSNEEIQRGFLKYESKGVRQNVNEVAGRLLYMDTYGSSLESVHAILKAMQNIEVKKGCRKIAVIGERPTFSDDVYDINYKLGQDIMAYEGIDEIIINGEDPNHITGPKEIHPQGKADLYKRAIYNGALSVVRDDQVLSYSNNIGTLAQKLRYQTKPGDVILLKGRSYFSLWGVADMAFGTGYTKSPAISPLAIKRKRVKTKTIVGEDYDCLNGINLTGVATGIDNTKIVIPSLIEGRRIVRIGEDAFANQSELGLVVFGIYVRGIGDRAFYKCGNLGHLELPSLCHHIGIESFAECKNMVRASMLGIGHISKYAFRGCENLKEVLISEKCATIEDGAFDECGEILFRVPENSFAEEWAIKHGYRVEYIDAQEELGKLSRNGTRLYPPVYGMEKVESYDSMHDYTSDENSNSDTITISVVGDIMVHDSQLNGSVDNVTGIYNFDKLFSNTKKYLNNADLAIGNVETVFAGGAYTGYPKFNSPDELAYSIAESGIDVAACANNHIFDGKGTGIIRTKRVLNNAGLEVVGIKETPDEKSYIIVERKGIKIAVINYTYCSPTINGVRSINYRALDSLSAKLVNGFSFENPDEDLEKVKNDIEEARNLGASIIVVYYHWGIEYEPQANVLQKYIAHCTAEMGADIIFGSHAHVLQEMDEITVIVDGNKKKVPVFYGMGNYSWSSRMPRPWRETIQHGAIGNVVIRLDKKEKTIEKIEPSYIPLYIKEDYITNKFDYAILSLNDMQEEEIVEFNRRNKRTIEEIRNDIREMLLPEDNNSNGIEYLFNEVITINVGDRIDPKTIIPSLGNISILKSENAPIACALDSNTVLAVSPGIAGFVAISEQGMHKCFVVKVKGIVPHVNMTLVDENNRVPDIFRPTKVVTGVNYGLTLSVRLDENAAKAWLNMKKAAASEGINIRVVSGFRTNEVQLKKHISLLEERCDKESIFMPPGHSDHQIGTVLDITNSPTLTVNNAFEECVEWIKDNAAYFGFVVLNVSESDIHIRYVGYYEIAKEIQELSGGIEQFVRDESLYRHYLDINDKPIVYRDSNVQDEEGMSLKNYCDAMGIGIPLAYKEYQSVISPGITLPDKDIEKNSIVLHDSSKCASKVDCANSERNNALIVFSDENKDDTDFSGVSFRQIKVPNIEDLVSQTIKYFWSKIENVRNITAISNNETNGLVSILYAFMSDNESVESSFLPYTETNILKFAQNGSLEGKIFVQDISEITINNIKDFNALVPSIAVISGYKKSSDADQNKTRNEVLLDYIDWVLSSGGKVVVNIDEVDVTDIKRDSIVSISTKDPGADYYMGVKLIGETIDAFIRKKEEVTPVAFSFSGKLLNEMLNILAAYAVSDMLGSTPKAMPTDFEKYQTALTVPSDLYEEYVKSINILSTDNAISITWSDMINDITGYHVRCYTANRLVRGMHVYDDSSYVFNKLKPNKKYTITIRPYAFLDGEKIYGKTECFDCNTK